MDIKIKMLICYLLLQNHFNRIRFSICQTSEDVNTFSYSQKYAIEENFWKTIINKRYNLISRCRTSKN